MSKLVPIGFGAAAVIALFLVGCGSSGSTASEASADRSSTPRPSVTSPSGAADDAIRDFLAARIAGDGAQQYLGLTKKDIPLLYETTSGARYERAEFDRVRGIEWPYGLAAYRVRLFAGATVVEQLVFRGGGRLIGYQADGYGTELAPTTEDGRPVGVPYSLADGAVTLQVPHPWVAVAPGGSIDGILARLIPQGPGVRPTTDGGERHDWDQLVVLADAAVVGKSCETGPGRADAEALAASIRSYPDLRATTPVAVKGGEADALMMDVLAAAGASVPFCDKDIGVLRPLVDLNAKQSFQSTGRATGRGSGNRMRLYLFDAPQGSPRRILAIAIVAPESRFESVVEAADRIVDSVAFHVR